MGEYHYHGGGKVQVLKLGTMDDWRYVRREEALRLRACDTGGDLEAGLADPGTLWRFPWPWEDGEGEAAITERSMFKAMTLDAGPIEEAFRRVEHDFLVVCASSGSGPIGPGVRRPDRAGYQVNIWVPCPFRPDFNLKTSVGGGTPNMQIWGERFDKEGNGRTVYRCGYCEAPFSLDREETEALRAKLAKDGERVGYEWSAEIAKRLKARLPDAPLPPAAA